MESLQNEFISLFWFSHDSIPTEASTAVACCEPEFWKHIPLSFGTFPTVTGGHARQVTQLTRTHAAAAGHRQVRHSCGRHLHRRRTGNQRPVFCLYPDFFPSIFFDNFFFLVLDSADSGVARALSQIAVCDGGQADHGRQPPGLHVPGFELWLGAGEAGHPAGVGPAHGRDRLF
jgi:hypothetical protein